MIMCTVHGCFFTLLVLMMELPERDERERLDNTKMESERLYCVKKIF
jgi:hypothetical protein